MESQSEAGDEDDNQSEESNSFVEEDKFNTYKLTRKEQLDKQRHQEKEKFKLKRKKKAKGQHTNVEARKNKPAQMVIHKVKREQNRKNDKNLTMRIKNVKRQLGR